LPPQWRIHSIHPSTALIHYFMSCLSIQKLYFSSLKLCLNVETLNMDFVGPSFILSSVSKICSLAYLYHQIVVNIIVCETYNHFVWQNLSHTFGRYCHLIITKIHETNGKKVGKIYHKCKMVEDLLLSRKTSLNSSINQESYSSTLIPSKNTWYIKLSNPILWWKSKLQSFHFCIHFIRHFRNL
jgi:hypothetical protein